MSAFRKFILGCALGLAALQPFEASAMMPFRQTAIAADRRSDVVEARVVCDDYGCQRVWRPHHHRRHYGRPRVYEREIYRPRRGYNSHVEWCLNRYRSYNPNTNLFLAYGGVYKSCQSPWG